MAQLVSINLLKIKIDTVAKDITMIAFIKSKPKALENISTTPPFLLDRFYKVFIGFSYIILVACSVTDYINFPLTNVFVCFS